MSNIFSIKQFIEPDTKYKILTPFKAVRAVIQYHHNIGGYSCSSLNLNFRRNSQWYHGWRPVPPTELIKVENTFGIKFNPNYILMPLGLTFKTTKTPYGVHGIRFSALAKYPNAPFYRFSVIIPWNELNFLRFETL